MRKPLVPWLSGRLTAGGERLEDRLALAGEFSLLKDTNEENFGSDPYGFVESPGRVYFMADDGIHGFELWKTDGTEAGTSLLADLTPGKESSVIEPVATAGGLHFFNKSGRLFATNGTESGTQALFEPGTESPQTQYLDFSVVGAFTYFMVRSNSTNRLYRTQGTAESTVSVELLPFNITLQTDEYLRSIGGGSVLERVQAADNRLFLIAVDRALGVHAMLVSDGTVAGTSFVFRNVLATNFMPQVPGDNVLYATRSGLLGRVSPGTSFFAGITSGDEVGTPDGESFARVGNHLFYSCKTDLSATPYLCVHDTGTGITQAFDASAATPLLRPTRLMASADSVILLAAGVSTPFAFWRYDVPNNSLKRLSNGTGPTFDSAGRVSDAAIVNDNLIFRAYQSIIKLETSTLTATQLSADVRFDRIRNTFATLHGKVIFNRIDPVNGSEPAISDGTLEGTVKLKDVWRVSTTSGSPRHYRQFNEQTLFVVSSSRFTWLMELWATDGQTENTIRLTDFRLGATVFLGSAVANGTFYLAVDSGAAQRPQIWKTDGTAEGTKLLKEVTGAQFGTLSVGQMTAVGDTVFFVVEEIRKGDSLWRTDGTSEGTVLISSKFAEDNGFQPANLTARGGKLMFFVPRSDYTELWQTDGTEAGTTRVTVVPQELGANAVELGGILYFSARDSRGRNQIWRSDGTRAGTAALTIPGATWYDLPEQLTVVGDQLFFAAVGQQGRTEIWRTNGTAAGSVKVASMLADTVNPYLSLVDAQGTVFAVYRDTRSGLSVLFGDAHDGQMKTGSSFATDFSLPRVEELASVQNTLFLSLSTFNFSGALLWRTDGTAEGTFAIPEVSIAQDPPAQMLFANSSSSQLFVSNYQTSYGREPWIYRPSFDQTLADLKLSHQAVTENLPASTLVGSFASASNYWLSNDMFALVAGAGATDNALFQIRDHQLFTAARFDYEQKASYSVRARVTTATGKSLERVFTIYVNDVAVPGDITGDERVDLQDFIIMRSHFGKTDVTKAEGDLDGDGDVDLQDFIVLRSGFGK